MRAKRKYYEFNGTAYTIDQISTMFPSIKPSILNSRLKKGMSVEEAVKPQTYEEWIPEQYRLKDIIVCFDTALPVYPSMQPALGKRYLAIPHSEKRGFKVFYTIQLEKKKLIVYPGEFRILARKCKDQDCALPFGEKEDCEFYQCGMCLGQHP